MFLRAVPVSMLLAALLATPTPQPVGNFNLQFDHPPTPTCGGTLVVQAGQLLTFTVQASDNATNFAIKLAGASGSGAAQLPVGATMTPPLPIIGPAGQPVSSVFSWTPQPSQLGTYSIGFRAIEIDNLGQDVAKVGCVIGIQVVPPSACQFDSEIVSNFNGTAIPAGRTVWFNSVVKPHGIGPAGGVIHFDNSTIHFTTNGTDYDLNVPSSTITYSPSAVIATTSFNSGTGAWETTVPVTYTGNVFLAGLALHVATGLPGGINPVTWSGTFSTNVPGLDVHWQWAAAVYSTFDTDYNNLGVKPIDGNVFNPYPNSDHAGTPEAFKQYVTGGGRGGGGSNFTGSYSGTGAGECP
jgi:hypothetical protein